MNTHTLAHREQFIWIAGLMVTLGAFFGILPHAASSPGLFSEEAAAVMLLALAAAIAFVAWRGKTQPSPQRERLGMALALLWTWAVGSVMWLTGHTEMGALVAFGASLPVFLKDPPLPKGDRERGSRR